MRRKMLRLYFYSRIQNYPRITPKQQIIMDSNLESDALATSAIRSRQDFIIFLHQLRADYLKIGKDWKNQNLSDFLEALSAYTADIPGYYNNMSVAVNADTASWRVFADMLRGATIYE